MDKFDELSNNELREQLKVHNLGNFPVTDTTRNALIRKLRNTLNGPTKPVKVRRETLHAVKHSSGEESESDAELKKIHKPKAVNNRRATIAASASTKLPATKTANTTNGAASEKVPIKVAPVRSKSPARKLAVPEPVSYFADASDDDLVAAAEEAEKLSRRKARTSRSPSLTKSSVVTTSYKHTIEPLVEQHDNDVILINDNSDAEYSSDMLEKIRKPSTPTSKIGSNIENRRKTLQVGPSISTNFTSINTTEKPIENTSSAYKRRYTSYTSEQDNHGLDNPDDVLDKVETPFLSNFTRRLAQLKAEQLPGTDTSFDYQTPKLTTSTYLNEYRSVYGTSQPADRYRDKQVSLTKNKKNPSVWSTLEHQLRWPLLIILIVFIAVSAYVFLSSNY